MEKGLFYIMAEGVNLSMIYLINCKNFCKCHNVPPPSTTIKINKLQKLIKFGVHNTKMQCIFLIWFLVLANQIWKKFGGKLDMLWW
jgi:hypothetical protein